METVIKLLHFFMNGKIYGEIRVKFQAGKVVYIEKIEQVKL